MPNYMHVGKGSETGTPATLHSSLRRQHSNAETNEEAVKTVICGPLTSNLVVLLNVVGTYVLC